MPIAGGEGGIRTPDTVARMPHFECGAFNRSATSPKPKKRLKRPQLDGRYLTKQAKTDKGRPGYIAGNPWHRHHRIAEPMPDALKFDRIRKELRGIGLTLGLVA